MLFDTPMLEDDLNASTESGFLETHHQSQILALERSIEHIFSHIHSRIIFLNHTGWICFADLNVHGGGVSI
jgi:hypothetical protein